MWDELLTSLRAWELYAPAAPEWAWLGWLLAAGLAWGLVRLGWGWKWGLPQAPGWAWPVGWLGWLAWLPRALRYAALALLLLALLRPQTFRNSSQSSVQSIDIYLVLDVSGSMRTPDLKPDHITAAKATLKRFLDGVKGDRVGLVVFAGKAFTQCPLTFDYDVVKWFIDQAEVGTVGMDGTAVGDGLLLAVSRLVQEPKAGQVVVLATDGSSNTGQDPRLAAQFASQAGIKVYTIGIGVKGGAVLTQRDPWGRTVQQRMEEPDEPTLQAIAAATGGRYYRAADNEGLQGIFQQIANLEKREVKLKNRRDADEHFFIFLLCGAALLLGEALLRLRLRIVA